MEKLNSNELTAMRWMLGQLLLVISFTGAYALDLGAQTLITIALCLILLSFPAAPLLERIPRLAWRIAPALLLVFVVTDFTMAGGDVLPPLFRMVLLLALFRGLQVRTQREDLQLLLLSLFLLIVTGVLSQEISFGLQMLIYAPVAMGHLFVVNLSTLEPDVVVPEQTGRVFDGFKWTALVRHIWRRMDYGTLVSGLALFLFMTAMSLLLFILMPRFDIGAALPFPRLQTSSSLTGFSDRVEFGDVVSILEDDAIAMRVDVETGSPPARPYWRMVALDAYYNGGFLVSPRVARDHQKVQHYIFRFQHDRRTRLDNSIWTVYMEGGISSYIPGGDAFRSFRFKNRMELQLHDLTRTFQTKEISASTLSIRYSGLNFEGIIPYGLEDQQLIGLKPVFVDTQTARYLEKVTFPGTMLAVPDGNANRRILSDLLRKSGINRPVSVEDFAQRAVSFLQRDRGYSLESEIPAGEADRILRWAASGQPGHCELYAGALALMARAAGIPSRIITGFVGGDWNGYENYFMVRNRNAHAWCELFDPSRGWIRVDPTPGYATDPGSVDEALSTGRLAIDRTFKAYLDSLRILWFRRVIQFDSEDQQEMAEIVKDVGSLGLGWASEQWNWMKEQFAKDWQAFKHEGNWEGLVTHNVKPLLVIIIVALLAYLITRRRKKTGFEELTRRRAGKALYQRKMRGLPEDGMAHEDLCRIRYGPVSSWPMEVNKAINRLGRLKE